MPDAAIAALVVGAVTRDLEPGGSARPGGVVHYAGLALARLGAATRAVTRVRADDAHELLQPLRAQGVEVLALPSRETTTYRNDYSGARDGHELLAVSDPIGPDDIPARWRTPDLVHLGPLHRGDLLPDVAAALGGFKGLDVQGLVREAGPHGTRLAPFAELSQFLGAVDVMQASEAELEAALAGAPLEEFLSHQRVREMIITRGRLGATLITAGSRSEVPARALESRHPVGAGDVFLASYLFLRRLGRDPLRAARGAVEICAQKIESGEVPKGFRPRPTR